MYGIYCTCHMQLNTYFDNLQYPLSNPLSMHLENDLSLITSIQYTLKNKLSKLEKTGY